MQYEIFRRNLYEKYSTRLHIADHLIDQFRNKNITEIQKDVSHETICYLPTVDTNKKIDPYFNECILAAKRVKHNRNSMKDRRICYENLILAEKLERIKKQSPSNYSKSLKSKVDAVQKKKPSHFIIKNDETDVTDDNSCETVILSYDEDDQNTEADVDVNLEHCDSTLSLSEQQQNMSKLNYSKSNLVQLKITERSRSQNTDIYHHLNEIDTKINRDRIDFKKSLTPKHFSVSILPYIDSDMMTLSKTHSQVISNSPKCAFKKEILFN